MSEEPLWGGRFSERASEDLRTFADSLSFDIRLLPHDVQATAAHARALERAGILSSDERAALEEALDTAVEAFASGAFSPSEADEDVHSALERFLIERSGATGAKIHAGRSRNDLVVTDLRLWLKEAISQVLGGIQRLQEVFFDQAASHADTIAPGFTHLQRAQPVLLGHHLLAHGFALTRDFTRMESAYRHCDVSGLGAAAFAGTSIPLDVRATAADLGFSSVFYNSADAVGSRDFALEFLAAAAILAISLSRIGEEIVLWTSEEFGFARLSDAYSTGSSIMPQKRNPDVAELARSKAGRVAGDFIHLLVVLKGLPFSYNRDLQEDKEPLFDAADTLTGTLRALAGALGSIEFDTDALEDAAGSSGGAAASLAEYLALQGIPFREAHGIVGALVASLEDGGRDLSDLTAAELAAAHPHLAGAAELLEPRAAMASRRTHGGTAPERVAEQLEELRAVLGAQAERLGKISRAGG